MSTQLRLVEPPASPPNRPKKSARPGAKKSAVSRSRGNRRAVNWGDWNLDARTRSVGRAGVARARRALEQAAAAQELSQAS